MAGKRFGAACTTVNLERHLKWPSVGGASLPRERRRRGPETARLQSQGAGEWWQKLAEAVGKYPEGQQAPWGVPFTMAAGKGPRAILAAKGRPDVTVRLRGKATFLCLLHEWRQLPEAIKNENPCEGLVVGEYEIAYADGTKAAVPVRGRFEVNMAESPGPAWLAVPFNQWKTVDPTNVPQGSQWGWAQTGVAGFSGAPLLYAMPNPHPEKALRSLTIRGLRESPLLVAGLTLYRGGSHPLRHLPRRTYRVRMGETPPKIAEARVDLGGVARVEQSSGPRGKKWLTSPYAGLYNAPEPVVGGEQLIEAFGSEDATVTVRPEGKRRHKFSLGEAFHRGQAASGAACLEVLGKTRQWMRVVIRDAATGKPTPARIHISGACGEYIAPYGHHAQINARWFEDYGADVVAGGRNFAYVQGEFTTDLPVGNLYIELYKGFEYEPTRAKVAVRPGQAVLELSIERGADWRRDGWVTADTHVHFISPHTAWLQAQGEGVNVVNLLASQWGRLFTNVGDITGKPGVVENDTIVYVGTENRNHMLGHMSMLGTQGLPVYPMCCGGPSESYVGDPDFMALAEWARENKRKGGVVIRPHYPYCGHTEDPVPILKGLVDALEIRNLRGTDFPTQEWYRYLNCGYRVAVCGGTDKMGAYCPVGWMRTYALLDPQRPFDYEAWAAAVRAGRTFSSTGPLIDLRVDGHRVGDSITMDASGGTLEVQATAEAVWPLGGIEIVHDGRVVASERGGKGIRQLRAAARVRVERSGWLAARCVGLEGHPDAYLAAHTSPVYLKVGDTRAFDGPAAQHMLALVEGGIEYLNTLATAFDEASRKRLVRLYQEAQAELRGRLLVEAKHPHHPGSGPYHTHGHGAAPGHEH